MHSLPKFLVAGDGGLVVEFGTEIDEAVNARVIALEADLSNEPVEGVKELVPTYRSLFILYDPLRTGWRALKERISERLARVASNPPDARCWTVPVTYGEPESPDLGFVAETCSMTPEQVIGLHSSSSYKVYMIGFSPGYAYLGGLPEALHVSRRATPRQSTPSGGVAIGGMQASVGSLAAPSGWHFIGRTPERIFDPNRADPFLIRAGDRIRFSPVSHDEYERLDRCREAGEVVARLENTG